MDRLKALEKDKASWRKGSKELEARTAEAEELVQNPLKLAMERKRKSQEERVAVLERKLKALQIAVMC